MASQNQVISAQAQRPASEKQADLIGKIYAEKGYPAERRYSREEFLQLTIKEAAKHIDAVKAWKPEPQNDMPQTAVRVHEPAFGMAFKLAYREVQEREYVTKSRRELVKELTLEIYELQRETRDALLLKLAEEAE